MQGLYHSQFAHVPTCACACAGHTQQLQGAVSIIEAAGPLAWWRVPVAVAGFAALVMAAAYLTHVEKRCPLVYYKSRRFQARAANPFLPFCDIARAL